ncbi:MAG TPA: peptidoglycan DD-metalloendopeptidase family protein [Acidimicrobiales bacterium]|nr:peptidoglycan DD-metalloendopeptidase family protein [Acidimicrobiales bacterium]
MRRAGVALAASLLTLLLIAPAAGAATADVAKQVAAAKARANAAAARLSQAESALALAERDVDSLAARTAANRERLQHLQGRVVAIAVQRYMGGAGGVTLATADPGAIARTDAIIRLLTVGASDALEEFRVTKADLDASRRALNARLADRRSAVARLQADRRKAIAELERLGKTLDALNKTSSRASRGRASGVIATGDWICPVQGPHSFSNDWGAPRSGGRSHQGNDILAPRGTPVVASVAGGFSHNFSPKGGNSYYLHGKDGNTYFGAHLDSYSNAAGSVAAGTVLGYVGDTGDAKGGPTHLHFEIHPGGGAAVNPYATLVKYC